MADFIRQLAEEAGRTSVKASVRLRSSSENNDSINAEIRGKSGRGSGALAPGALNSQIRKAAASNNVSGDVDDQIRSSSGRVHTGSNGGPAPSFDRNLADQIAQDLLDGGGSDGI